MPDTSSGQEHGSLRPGREREIPKEIAERPWKGCMSKSVLSDAQAYANVQDCASGTHLERARSLRVDEKQGRRRRERHMDGWQ